MLNQNSPIGVLDTGVGGLTVVKEIQKLLPHEDIIYIGDSINCPYGNKSKEEIKLLTAKMLDFLQNNNIKVAAIACNTISSALGEYDYSYDFKIKGIVHPAAHYVEYNQIKDVGIFGTAFTIDTGCYTEILGKLSEDINVVSKSSQTLAALIESGNFEDESIKNEVKDKIGSIIEKSPDVKDIVLACTHYPIVMDVFKECFPDINFINPAFEQAMSVKRFLKHNGGLKTEGTSTTKIYTTGNTENVYKVSQKIGVREDSQIIKVIL